jgi:hypothetical protein
MKSFLRIRIILFKYGLPTQSESIILVRSHSHLISKFLHYDVKEATYGNE